MKLSAVRCRSHRHLQSGEHLCRPVWTFGSSSSVNGQNFAVQPNTPMTMVVSGVQNAPGVNCGPVAYTINGVTPPIPKSVPTLSEWSMILLSLLMAGGTMFYLRRKTTDAQAA